MQLDKTNHKINIYRTNNYIVKQVLMLNYVLDDSTILYSYDSYYLRNAKLDKAYDRQFKSRLDLNGKRIHATAYVRKYFN